MSETRHRAAAVAAIRTLEELTDGPRGSNVNISIGIHAGYVIDLSEPAPTTIDAKAIRHD